MTENIRNKVVVITGASSGLGEATARQLAPLGARLVLGARRVDRLQTMAKGRTVAQLARAVGYSEREMFRLLRQLYDRMGVRNRTEALLKAAQCGLLAE